jgi:hypothetical protein
MDYGNFPDGYWPSIISGIFEDFLQITKVLTPRVEAHTVNSPPNACPTTRTGFRVFYADFAFQIDYARLPDPSISLSVLLDCIVKDRICWRPAIVEDSGLKDGCVQGFEHARGTEAFC